MLGTLADYNEGKSPGRLAIADGCESEYTVDAYSILHHLCTLGNVQKMYIPKCMRPGSSLKVNQELNEAQVAERLQVERGGQLLDLGCGVGRIAHHIAKLSGCTVTGVNIDPAQLENARAHAKATGFEARTIFKMCDFNALPLPFADCSFDGVYAVAALLIFIKNHDEIFAEIFRVLKPGARFVVMDAVLLDAFDRNIPRHMHLMAKSRMIMAGCVFLHYKFYEDMAARAGFTVELSQSDAKGAADFPVLRKEHAHWDTIQAAIRCLVATGVLPEHINALIARLRDGGDELVAIEEEELLTMTWDFVFRKQA